MTEPLSSALLMFVSHRAAENRVYDAVRAAGFGDLTMAQCRIAQRLSPDGIRVTDLAEAAQVTKQTAGALVDELERAGYVTRIPDPADARARLVLLSTRGAALCALAATEVAAIETEWRDHLSPQAYHQLRDALVALREITDPDR
ncbi:MarR family winged helix-turn-helix transcriptional regulator [soil metagenome]